MLLDDASPAVERRAEAKRKGKRATARPRAKPLSPKGWLTVGPRVWSDEVDDNDDDRD